MCSTMGYQSKRELLLQIQNRYLAASYSEKKTILTEFVMATEYDRKYAIRLLRGTSPSKPVAKIKRPRDSKYGASVIDALSLAWRTANCICTKRLVPFLPELVPKLESHGHLKLTAEDRKLLLAIGSSMAERLLRATKGVKGKSLTKPGTLLKSNIPIRTFADWENTEVGFFEVDLVAHCGNSVAGTFMWTLVMTDVASGWTEFVALPRRSAAEVVKAIRQIQKVLPFRILGIDVDNGGEFINKELIKFCQNQEITFTRCRAYRKNDQCFVEQKNGAVVRGVVGYDRLEGAEALAQLTELYLSLRLYNNFYQPSMKLLTKTRDGDKVQRTYDLARTPYRRILDSDALSKVTRDNLSDLSQRTDPVELMSVLRRQQDSLWKIALAIMQDSSPGPLPEKLPVEIISGPKSASETQARKYKRQSKPRAKRPDPFAEVNETLHAWLLESPEKSCRDLLSKLREVHPGKYLDYSLRRLQREASAWRAAADILAPNYHPPYSSRSLVSSENRGVDKYRKTPING